MTAKTNTQRAATHAARQRAAGLVKVSAWVHRDDVAKFRESVIECTMRTDSASVTTKRQGPARELSRNRTEPA